MRRAVVTYYSRTVDTQYHMQVLQRHIMNDVIVRPLQERRIDIAVRQHPRFRQTGAKSHGMSFGNSHIEHSVRQLFLHDTHATAARHRRRDTHNLLVPFRQIK